MSKTGITSWRIDALLLCLMLGIARNAEAVREAAIDGPGTVVRGEPVRLTVRGSADFGLSGFSLVLAYDPERLRYESVSFDGGVWGSADYTSATVQPGPAGVKVTAVMDTMNNGKFVPQGASLPFFDIVFDAEMCTGASTVGFGSGENDNIFVDTNAVGHDLASTDLVPLTFCVIEGGTFIRGNARGDPIDATRPLSAAVNVLDGLFILDNLFGGGLAPPCLDAADANNDARYNIVDAIFIFQFTFGHLGAALPEPYTSFGPDTGVSLGCLMPPETTGCAVPASCAPALLVPSANYATIQQAIDAAADGASIRIAPGLYRESLRIDGKRLRIAGSGISDNLLTEILGSSQEVAVITYGANAGGELRDLALSGGAFGIAGEGGPNAPPPSLEVKSCSITDTGRGVFGEFTRLTASEIEISRTSWNGLSILAVFEKIEIKNIVVRDADGTGLLIMNYAPAASILIADCRFDGNSNGGIAVFGHTAPVSVAGCECRGNHVAGITLVDADNATVSKCNVSSSQKGGDGRYGDGIQVYESEGVVVKDSSSSFNVRAGVAVFGCTTSGETSEVTLLDNALGWNLFDIEFSPLAGCVSGSAGSLVDKGCNTCPPARNECGACRGVSTSLSPVPVPKT